MNMQSPILSTSNLCPLTQRREALSARYNALKAQNRHKAAERVYVRLCDVTTDLLREGLGNG